MTTGEHRELIVFLGTKFGEMDAQFREVNAQFRAVDARFERVEAGLQEFRDEVDRRFSDVDQKMAAGFAEVKDLLRVSHSGLDRRVRRLEEE